VVQHTVFAGVTRNESSVRKGELVWTTVAMADFYTDPELTPPTPAPRELVLYRHADGQPG
jgi:hypothetical protein